MRYARVVSTALTLSAAIAASMAVGISDSTEQDNRPSAAKKSVWTLGVYAGGSPLALQPAPKAANPVMTAADVTDMKVDALAHPFLVIKDKRYYVFFTAKDLRSDKGGIALAESSDGTTWKFRRTVIREPFVQSHPYVFEWQNEYYLIPEAHTETSVRLYKTTAFPDEWRYVGNILEGDGPFISPTNYMEEMVETPVVQASGEGWNSAAMHHVDAHQTATGQWIAVVDALGLP